MEKSKEDLSSEIGLLRLLVMVFWSFVMLFIFCENGETVTHQFQVFNVELRQFNWYILPINVQKMFIIVVANAQQPSFIRGFANAICLRESFKKV